jgi:predicted MPP superfamily phosphohydrolase
MRQALSLFLLAGCFSSVAQGLRFKADGTFKIVQLTDLHLGEVQAKDKRTLKVRTTATNCQVLHRCKKLVSRLKIAPLCAASLVRSL